MNAFGTVCLFLMICLGSCRDFYIGMFKRNDFLVAQDRLFKERVPFRKMYAKYGRTFNCPITYFRIVDRLGYGAGPTVEIIRGGLLKKYVVARLTSPYNLPISVNVYVGCENKIVTTSPTTTLAPSVCRQNANETVTSAGSIANATTEAAAGKSTGAAEEKSTTV